MSNNENLDVSTLRPLKYRMDKSMLIVLICMYSTLLLLDFSLTVKAATLIFISGCGSAISSAKEGKSGFIYNLVKSYICNKLFKPGKRACIS